MNPEENKSPNISLQDSVEKTMNAFNPPPKPAETVPQPTEFPHPSLTNTGPLKSLRTYQGDVEEALAKNKSSVSSIVIAEQKRREETLKDPDEDVKTNVKNKSFVFVGVSLFVLGLFVIGAVYFTIERGTAEVTLIKQTKALVGYSEEKNLDVTNLGRQAIVSAVVAEKESFKLPVNSVLYVNTTHGTETPEDVSVLLPTLFPHVPNALVRALESQYMVGVYSFDTNEPFIILTTNDYASSYAGMLKWEEGMVSDMENIFSLKLTASSTPVFEDEALRNKDLRIVKDADDNTILLYSFVDKNTIIVTTNEKIFTAVLGKYLISKSVK